MCSNLIEDKRCKICAGSRSLCFFAWPYNGIVVCRYKLVPRGQVVRIYFDLFNILFLTPCLFIVFKLSQLFHCDIFLAQSSLKVEGWVGAFCSLGLRFSLSLFL